LIQQTVSCSAIFRGDASGRWLSQSQKRAGLVFEEARNALVDHFRLRREQVELPDDLTTDVEEPAAVDSLPACISRMLSDLQGMMQE